MLRISSNWTFFYKRIFPAIFIVFLLVFIGINLFVTARSNTAFDVPFLVIPIAMMGFVFFIMKKLVFDMVDEVYDDGDALVVRNRGQEQRIQMAFQLFSLHT